jgi:hypothetical protein
LDNGHLRNKNPGIGHNRLLDETWKGKTKRKKIRGKNGTVR